MTFTSQKPTVPGAYWWRRNCQCLPSVVEVRDECGLWAMGVGCVASMTCEWSPRLVPVDEVEKAWKEAQKLVGKELGGIGNDDDSGCCEYELPEYNNSRARRVVEGKEME